MLPSDQIPTSFRRAQKNTDRHARRFSMRLEPILSSLKSSRSSGNSVDSYDLSHPNIIRLPKTVLQPTFKGGRDHTTMTSLWAPPMIMSSNSPGSSPSDHVNNYASTTNSNPKVETWTKTVAIYFKVCLVDWRLRRPLKRCAIIASDEKRCPYLPKMGEDGRLHDLRDQILVRCPFYCDSRPQLIAPSFRRPQKISKT